MPDGLSSLVSASAQRLGVAGADNAVEVTEHVLADIGRHFGLDVAFLRHNDPAIRATVLVAQWPVRTFVPDPDPIGIVYFDEADPIFAMAEHLKEPRVIRPTADPDYRQRIEDGTTIPAISMAAVPLLTTSLETVGTLGFIKFGDREWTDAEIDGLKLIATLFSNLKSRLEATDALKWIAAHDDLTGLANRRTLVDYLHTRLEPERPGPVAVLYLDLDQLKPVNDLLGHSAGDQVLTQFAARMQDLAGDDAFLARYGGNGVIAVFDDPLSLDEAHTFAKRIRPHVQARFAVDAGYIQSTVSVGVAVGTPGVDTTSDLLRYTEHSLTAAKAAGGNTITVFSDELAARHALRTDIELHLPDALEDADLFLQYQPEVDLLTGDVMAIGCHLRWNHPTRGLLGPETFFPVAETVNLAAELDRRILRLACEQLKSWRNEGLAADIPLRVRMSAVTTVTEGFVDHLRDTLAHFELPADALSVQVAESVVVAEAAASRENLLRLKELGVSLVLDDFGTGYSVFAGLKSLPFDTVKIDRSLVRNIDQDAGDVAILRSVIALTDAFGLRVVADGLQTIQAAQMLIREGCRQAQGALLSMPLDAREMGALLTKPVIRPLLPTSVKYRTA